MDKDKSVKELKGDIKKVWVELGREADKLQIDNKTKEELVIGLEKLKAIKMGFGLLFKSNGNHKLALSLLREVFLKDKEQDV